MNKTQHLSYNASLSSSQLIDMVAGNIVSASKQGHRAQRWAFSDYMGGGELENRGVSWRQGKQEPRLGEWTKMMIRGRGLFTVKDNRTNEVMYTRLGDFHVDGAGNLVSKEGYAVQGTPLSGNFTQLQGPDPHDPDMRYNGDINQVDPFNNPFSNNAQELNPPGKPVSVAQNINLKIDPRNGKYLGFYDKIQVGEDGVIYGVDGRNVVSLYKLKVVNFNNPEGLRDVKDSVFWKPTKESGLPSMAASDSRVIGEALEKSNVWLKVETHYMTEAQRAYQAATQLHKLADKISATAIEMIQ